MNSTESRILLTNQIKKYKHFCLIGPITPILPNNIKCDCILLVDGGTNFKSYLPSSIPTISLGDGDSINNTECIEHILPSEKNFSDLAFALSILPDSTNQIDLFGFLGARRDHELFNLGEINHQLETRLFHATAYFDQSIIIYPAGTHNFSHNGIFSLASLFQNRVSLTGFCKYQMIVPTLLAPLSSLGLSNIGFGEIQITATHPTMILINSEEQKNAI